MSDFTKQLKRAKRKKAVRNAKKKFLNKKKNTIAGIRTELEFLKQEKEWASHFDNLTDEQIDQSLNVEKDENE